MANNLITTSIFAKAAVRILDNELVMGSRVYRGHESDFDKKVNGYEPGQTISVRKPSQFTVRTGATASAQDIVEGSTTITVNQQIGVDFKLTSVERTMNITELAERVIKPAMVPLANAIDRNLHTLAMTNFYNLVGTPGTVLGSYGAWLKGTQRLMEMAVPMDDVAGVISPADRAGLLGSLSSTYVQQIASSAIRSGAIGQLDGVDTYSTQNAPVLTTGSRTNGTVSGANQNVAYSSTQAKSWGQTLNVAGIGASGTVKAGEVFTIAGVNAVNPVTKAVLPYLQQFVVTADATADGSGNAALSIQPAIITSGAFQTVSAAPANSAVVTFSGTASTNYQQNFILHRNALSLVVVPLVMPDGATGGARESYKNLSVRVQPYYDGTNDISNWRLDVLYGTAAIDPRLGTRLNG